MPNALSSLHDSNISWYHWLPCNKWALSITSLRRTASFQSNLRIPELDRYSARTHRRSNRRHGISCELVVGFPAFEKAVNNVSQVVRSSPTRFQRNSLQAWQIKLSYLTVSKMNSNGWKMNHYGSLIITYIVKWLRLSCQRYYLYCHSITDDWMISVSGCGSRLDESFSLLSEINPSIRRVATYEVF